MLADMKIRYLEDVFDIDIVVKFIVNAINGQTEQTILHLVLFGWLNNCIFTRSIPRVEMSLRSDT